MAAPYSFGLSQEDERTEAQALRLERGDRVLCIASAGEMPLSLLALGADNVVAVDIDARQIVLTQLKLAAIRTLDRHDVLRFLGYLPASRAERRRLFAAVRPLVPREQHAFWEAHPSAIGRGPIWAGRYERYIRLLCTLARPVLRRSAVEGLFEQPSLDAQRAHFDRAFGTPLVRAIFRVAFDPRVYARGGMDPRSLQHRRSPQPLGEQFFARFRTLCTAHRARENHLLQLTLLGRLVDPAASPACLTAEGLAVLRSRHDQLDLRCAEVRRCLLAEPVGRFDKVHLSNLADWLSQEEFDALMRALAERVTSGRAVWRYLHANRAVPEDVRDRVRVDCKGGRDLAEADRFPFYGIVPASIGAPR